MLLSKIPVLDNGYVALLNISFSNRDISSLSEEYATIDSISLRDHGHMVLIVKCPLFVQLYLSKFNLLINSVNSQTLEAYKPISADIKSGERLDDEAIADDIARTTEALLINPTAYQADGADRFISQVITPINVYTTLIISGSYNNWRKAINKNNNLPTPIEAYINAVSQIFMTEWP